MILTISLPIKFQTCSIILRSGDSDGHWMVDMSCCSNYVTGFLTMFWHNCRHSRFHGEWPDCQHRGSQWPPTPLQIRFLLTNVDIRVYPHPPLCTIIKGSNDVKVYNGAHAPVLPFKLGSRPQQYLHGMGARYGYDDLYSTGEGKVPFATPFLMWWV